MPPPQVSADIRAMGGILNFFFLATDQCGNTASGNSGLFTFKGMISTGFLDASGGPAQGINYRFDNCSQTVCLSTMSASSILIQCYAQPFVYKSSAQTMISYDDPRSFGNTVFFILGRVLLTFFRFLAAKGKFINDNGLAGFAVWEISGDSNNDLVSAISDAMGIVQVCS